MTLRGRAVAFVLALTLLLVGVGAAIGYGVHQRHQAEQSLRQQLAPAAVATRTLLADIVDQETGERGYLITGDDTFLAPYRTGLRDTERTIGRLRRLLAGHPQTLDQLALVEEAIAVWHRVGADPEIAARQSGEEAAAARQVATGAGKAAFDALRATVERLQQLVDKSQRQASDQADAASTLLDQVLIAAGLLALFLVLLAGLLFGRWVLTPLRALREQLDRVTGGQLQEAIRPAGPMEMAVVGEAAEAMRRRIVTELDAARAARGGLAQRGPVVVGLQGELRPPRYVELPGVRAATAVHAAEGVLAGDVAHLVRLSEGRLGLVVIDVSGHGAEAGLLAVRLKHVISAALTLGHGPAVAMRAGCDTFTTEPVADVERFATCLIAEVDASTGQVRWANAGHPAALIVGVRGGRLQSRAESELAPTGPLLSSLGGTWREQVTEMESGQMLLAFSDGVTEARDRNGALLGVAGIGAAVEGVVADPAAVVDSCLAAAREHAADWDRDDVTVVAVTIGVPVAESVQGADRSQDPVS